MTYRPLLAALAVLLWPGAPATSRVPAVSVAEAQIAVHPSGRTWHLQNDGLSAILTVDQPDGRLRMVEFANTETDFDWLDEPARETRVFVLNEVLELGSPQLRFDRFHTTEYRGGVRLDLHFADAARRFTVVRSYALHPEAPVLEAWTRIAADTRAIVVDTFNAYDLPVARGTLRWITGHQTPPEAGGTFTSGWIEHEEDQRYDLGSDGRASESTVPWFAIDRGGDSLFGAHLWAGAWQLDTQRKGEQLRIDLSTAAIRTTVARGAAIESPHAILGVASGSLDAVARVSGSWIHHALRAGRPFEPLATYNTWFSYGTHTDEASMLAELDRAAALGVEQFVLDAGWNVGISDDPGDFTAGLGSWEVDAQRFPSGLAALREHAHARGMKFGLWVEPERVSVHTINRGRGAAERYLATANGRYDGKSTSASAAQVCLASAEARQWVATRLIELLDDVRPDLLKWDNNYWLECSRTAHGHGVMDGSFHHVRGLHSILGLLRDRYPDMQIENCSGGGNRLSFEMLEWTDLGWMDDRSSPSNRVRHHLEGLSAAFPPAYLYSFVMEHQSERMHETPDLSSIFRSRMPGAMGLSWWGATMVDAPGELAAREIAIYKMTREITRDAFAVVLTEQAPLDPAAQWDVIQHISRSTGAAVVFAFEGEGAPEHQFVRLRQLDPDQDYAISSVDYGGVGVFSGRELMTRGLTLYSGSQSNAQILVLHPQKPL